MSRKLELVLVAALITAALAIAKAETPDVSTWSGPAALITAQ